jgi:hypothetical protein
MATAHSQRPGAESAASSRDIDSGAIMRASRTT